MKPFDLDAAKRGEPIVRRDGERMRFIAHVPEADLHERVIVMRESTGAISTYSEQGLWSPNNVFSRTDLFMAPLPKRIVYVNIARVGYFRDEPCYSAEVFNLESAARKSSVEWHYPVAVAVPVEIQEE